MADETGTSVLICPVRLLSVRGGGGVHTSGERAGSKPVQPTGIRQWGQPQAKRISWQPGLGSFTLISSIWNMLGLQKGIPGAMGVYQAPCAAAMPPSPPRWRSGKGLGEARSLTASGFLPAGDPVFSPLPRQQGALGNCGSCSGPGSLLLPWGHPPSLCGIDFRGWIGSGGIVSVGSVSGPLF